MAVFPDFCGPSNLQRSRTVDAERTVNLFLEAAGAGSPQASPCLYPTPGIRVYAFLGSGPVRALQAQDGRAFGMGGSGFYELFPNHTTELRGLVQTSGTPATISSSGQQGHQLFITSGGKGYIFDLVMNTLTQITDDAFPENVISGLFFDSSFIALSAADGKFVVSDLYDGLAWNGLDAGIESQFSDQVIAMTRTHDNLWLFGTRNTAPWYNAGAGGAAGYVPIPSSLIEHGTAAPFACVEIDNAPIWLGQDETGAGMVWRGEGYTPRRVSTHALEYQLLGVRHSLINALAYGFQMQGHSFYVLYVPGLDTSWVYDIATDSWLEWAHWDAQYGRFFPHVGVNHCYAFGTHLIGDRQSGAVYELSLDFPDERIVL